MIRKLTIKVHISIKYKNPECYKKDIPTPMLLTKSLELIDKNPDNFKDWGFGINCLKQPCYCKNNNPLSVYVFVIYIVIFNRLIVFVKSPILLQRSCISSLSDFTVFLFLVSFLKVFY